MPACTTTAATTSARTPPPTRCPAPARAAPGTLADGSGTGWSNLALKGTWRPTGAERRAHRRLRRPARRYALALPHLDDHRATGWPTLAGPLASGVSGKTRLRSFYAQDAWAFAPHWKTVLGLRAEQWRANEGQTAFSSTVLARRTRRAARRYLSPKAALAYQALPDVVLKASAGPGGADADGRRALRRHVDDELAVHQRPEPQARALVDDGADGREGPGPTASLRLTVFTEDTHDSLYSQTTFDPVANRNISRVQNVGRIATKGLEAAYSGFDVLRQGPRPERQRDLCRLGHQGQRGLRRRRPATPSASASRTSRSGAPRRWRATGSTSTGRPRSARATAARSTARSTTPTSTASPTRASASTSRTDVRVRYQINRQWSAAVGIDNLNNDQYWNFHPYPQRSYSAELKFDL